MNLKNFFLAGLAGFFAYYLLGFLGYGMLFPNIYPCATQPNMMLIALGCLFPALALSYILTQISSQTSFMNGFKIGFILGLLNGIGMNCMMFSCKEMNTQNFFLDVILTAVIGGITGGIIALVNGKLSHSE